MQSLLLAQPEVTDISRYWSTRSPIGFYLVVVFATAVTITLIVVGIQQWRAERRGKLHSPSKLFGELCDAHGLTRSQRRCLKELSRLAGAVQPSLLFVRPDLFEDGVRRLLVRPRRDAEGGIAALRQKLFENDRSDPAPAPPPAS